MRLSNFIIMTCIFIFSCTEANVKMNCKIQTVNLKRYRDEQLFKISYCVSDSFKEIPAFEWGVRTAKSFKSSSEEYSIHFSIDTSDVTDAISQERQLYGGYKSLKDCVLNRQEIIIIDNQTKGTYYEFQKDSLYFNKFVGYNKESLIPFTIMGISKRKAIHFIHIIKSIKFERI